MAIRQGSSAILEARGVTNLNERVARIVGYDGPLIADIGYPEYSSDLNVALRDCVPWMEARGYWWEINYSEIVRFAALHRDWECLRRWAVTDPPSMAKAICEAVVMIADGKS
jgi:hypothetical protein